jgi:hypothetical protein
MDFELSKFMDANRFYKTLKAEWEKEMATKNPDFFTALFKTYVFPMLRASIGFLADICLQILIGVFIGLLIEFLMEGDDNEETGWTYVGLIILFCLMSYHIKHPSWFYIVQLAGTVR